MANPVNLDAKLQCISDYWTPKVIAELNDYQLKLVKIVGEFVWHQHDDTDELFICLSGEMSIDMPNQRIALKAGELFVVPKGVRHKPRADEECAVLLIEPRGVINTGDASSDRTAPNDQWI